MSKISKLNPKLSVIRARPRAGWHRRLAGATGLVTALLVTSGVTALFAQPTLPLVY